MTKANSKRTRSSREKKSGTQLLLSQFVFAAFNERSAAALAILNTATVLSIEEFNFRSFHWRAKEGEKKNWKRKNGENVWKMVLWVNDGCLMRYIDSTLNKAPMWEAEKIAISFHGTLQLFFAYIFIAKQFIQQENSVNEIAQLCISIRFVVALRLPIPSKRLR